MRVEAFDAQYCVKLNEQQKAAVKCIDGAILLLAVPGSGKTTVLVTRLGYMVHCAGINPENILTMTYTKSATEEMRSRFAALYGADYAKIMKFCTINSLSNQIIRYYASSGYGKRKPFDVADEQTTAMIIGRLYKRINDDYATDSVIKEIKTAITYIKNMMLTDEEIAETDFGVDNMAQIYFGYCQALEANGLMDYDDQMRFALRVLKRYPEILDLYQERYRYICVDEAQDTSKLQHEIIKLLASKYGNIFMVGDEDQSIYGFRAAYPDALLNFESDYSKAKVLLMEQNYRSTGEIVNSANSFIARNKLRHPKVIRPTNEIGVPIRVVHATNRRAQYLYLFELAKTAQERITVLFRNNESALPLIDLFERNGIGFDCGKEQPFFTHRVITDISNIIRFAFQPDNAELFMQLYYKLGSGLSKANAEYVCKESVKSGKTILEVLMDYTDLKPFVRDTVIGICGAFSHLVKCDARTALSVVWTDLRYGQYVQNNRLDAGKFDVLQILAEQERGPLELLERLSILQSLIQYHENNREHKVGLFTIHASKGLEYDDVYLMDVFDGILPSKTNLQLVYEEDHKRYEEDRRIYYVAMTRAKERLHLFMCANKDSEFTAEMMGYIPKEECDAMEVFSSLKQNLCGKKYAHNTKGKGTITACCDGRMLIEFYGGEALMMTYDRMFQERSTEVKYATESSSIKISTPQKSQTDVRVMPGMKMLHKSFGEGIVVTIEKGIASIRFSEKYGTRRIVLQSSLENGILRVLS